MLDVKTSPDTMPKTLLSSFDLIDGDDSHLVGRESELPHGLTKISPGSTLLGVKVSQDIFSRKGSVFAVVSELLTPDGKVAAFELVEVDGDRTMCVWR